MLLIHTLDNDIDVQFFRTEAGRTYIYSPGDSPKAFSADPYSPSLIGRRIIGIRNRILLE